MQSQSLIQVGRDLRRPPQSSTNYCSTPGQSQLHPAKAPQGGRIHCQWTISSSLWPPAWAKHFPLSPVSISPHATCAQFFPFFISEFLWEESGSAPIQFPSGSKVSIKTQLGHLISRMKKLSSSASPPVPRSAWWPFMVSLPLVSLSLVLGSTAWHRDSTQRLSESSAGDGALPWTCWVQLCQHGPGDGWCCKDTPVTLCSLLYNCTQGLLGRGAFLQASGTSPSLDLSGMTDSSLMMTHDNSLRGLQCVLSGPTDQLIYIDPNSILPYCGCSLPPQSFASRPDTEQTLTVKPAVWWSSASIWLVFILIFPADTLEVAIFAVLLIPHQFWFQTSSELPHSAPTSLDHTLCYFLVTHFYLLSAFFLCLSWSRGSSVISSFHYQFSP